jgi:hypothetical protein
MKTKIKIKLEVPILRNTDCTTPSFEVVKIIFDNTQTTKI